MAAKWGPSISHFQIRSLQNPDQWGPADRMRVAELLRDPGYASKAAFEISKQGTDFTPWTAFRTGTYLPHVGKDFTLVTGHPRADLWDTRFVTSALLGQWVVAPGHFVNNNVWNDKESGSQSLYAASPSKWAVVANHSRTDVRPGSIKSYPDTQKNFTDRPVDSFTEITAEYSMTSPPVGEWNECFDIWINGIGSKCTHEIMLWTNHRYNGVIPPKNAVESTTVTIGGQGYTAWKRQLNSTGAQYIALAMNPMHASGKVDLLAVFKWLIGKGWLEGTDKIAAVEFGIEIANTAGEERIYYVDDYQLNFT